MVSIYIYIFFFFYRTGTIHIMLNTDEDLDMVNILHVYRCWQDACDGDTDKEPAIIVNILYMCAGKEYTILGTDEEPENMVNILCVYV